jgi:hypothetical protein
MLAIALAPDAKVFTYQRLERDGPLFEIANEFGVPVEEISSYCDAYYHARLKRGNDRKRAIEDLPTDPVERILETVVPAIAEEPKKNPKKKARVRREDVQTAAQDCA